MNWISRRDLMRIVGSALPWLAGDRIRGGTTPVTRPKLSGTEKALGIVSLDLLAADPRSLRSFYCDRLGFSILEDGPDLISVQAGTTRISFRRAPPGAGLPTYHFAFNVPENKLAPARAWLARRAPLVKRDGEEIFHFPTWNAHSVYFFDPAGNLLELIARHDLPNRASGPFSAREILYASEIGLVVDDVAAEVSRLGGGLGIPIYRPGSPSFVPLGDEHGLLIVVQRDRTWFPTQDRRAQVHPVAATLAGVRAAHWRSPLYPFEIQLTPTTQ